LEIEYSLMKIIRL